MTPTGPVPHVLTIAGSDPSGGAGIQADLKAFSALGAYGCAVLTSLTAQSTRGVSGVHPVPAPFVREQVQTLVDDVRLDTVKTGMLGTPEVVRTVHDLIREGVLPDVVVDPVMVSTAGSRLLDEDAVDEIRALVPSAALITPNLPEAAVLLGHEPDDAAATVAQMEEHARRLHDLGCRRVLLKGGHAPGGADQLVDVLVDGDDVHHLTGPRVPTRNTHGTGCSLSAAIAALRPQHDGWVPAVAAAREWLVGALQHADELSIGSGPGPVHHFWRAWD